MEAEARDEGETGRYLWLKDKNRAHPDQDRDYLWTAEFHPSATQQASGGRCSGSLKEHPSSPPTRRQPS